MRFIVLWLLLAACVGGDGHSRAISADSAPNSGEPADRVEESSVQAPDTARAQVGFNVIDEVHVGPFNVVLEKTTLSTIGKTLPGGRTTVEGTGDDAIHLLCYSVVDGATGPDTTFVIFGANIMTGFDLTMRVTLTRSAQPSRNCTMVSLEPNLVNIEDSIRLGMQRAELRHMMETQPDSATDDMDYWGREERVKSQYPDVRYAILYNDVKAYYVDGKLWTIIVWKGTDD